MKKLLLALFIATPAFAEFTTQERAEISKVVTHVGTMGNTYNQIGDGIRDYGNAATRPYFYATFIAALRPLEQCAEAIRNLHGITGSISGPELPGTPSAGFANVTACAQHSASFADQLNALADAVLVEFPAAGTWANSIDTLADQVRGHQLGSFNMSLTYANPQPGDNPRFVGQHGHYVSGQHNAYEALVEFLRAVAWGSNFYGRMPVWPTSANGDFREFIRYAVTPIKNIPKVIAMPSGVVASGDASKIAQDLAAATQIGVLRGEPFFRALFMYELVVGDTHQPNTFAGRPQKGGVIGNFAIGFAEFPKLQGKVLEANTKEAYLVTLNGVKNLNRAPSDIAANANARQLPSWSEALESAWKATDDWGNSLFLFFYPPDNVCGPGTHPEPDAEGTPLCVPNDPGGSQVSCGPGTHLEGSVCLPDPCPTCPPPPACPSFLPELVLIDPVTAEARCVEVQ